MGDIERTLGRLEQGQKDLGRKLDTAVTRDECNATAGGIRALLEEATNSNRALLEAHKAEIVQVVKDGDGYDEMKTLLRRSMAALATALAILYLVVEKFIR